MDIFHSKVAVTALSVGIGIIDSQKSLRERVSETVMGIRAYFARRCSRLQVDDDDNEFGHFDEFPSRVSLKNFPHSTWS